MLIIARSLAVVTLVPAVTIFRNVDVWVNAIVLSDCSRNPKGSVGQGAVWQHQRINTSQWIKV